MPHNRLGRSYGVYGNLRRINANRKNELEVEEMSEIILQEIKLRDNGKTGKLGNIRYLQLLCLAYSLGLIK